VLNCLIAYLHGVACGVEEEELPSELAQSPPLSPTEGEGESISFFIKFPNRF
jgi:hypothetical protein